MALTVKRSEVGLFIQQFESSAGFLQHMRDKCKPGSTQWEMFNRELLDCQGQRNRLIEAVALTDSLGGSLL